MLSKPHLFLHNGNRWCPCSIEHNHFMLISFWDHPIETIEKALHIRRRIEALQKSINEILGGDDQLPLPYFMVRDGGNRRKVAAKARKARKKAAAKTKKAERIVVKATRKEMLTSQRVRWATQKDIRTRAHSVK